MRTRTFLRQCLDVPVALGALLALGVAWWLQAVRGRPPTPKRHG